MTHASTAEGRAAHSGDATAPDGADPAVRAGSVPGLPGPDGAGRTTTVLLRPGTGHATAGGHDVVRQVHRVRRLNGPTARYVSVDETPTGTGNPAPAGRRRGQSCAHAVRVPRQRHAVPQLRVTRQARPAVGCVPDA